MELRRQSDNSLISDKIYWSEVWEPDHPKQAMKTTNNVTYLQDRGRMEWFAPVTFVFCNEYPNSTIANMYALIRLARRRQWFVFTDKEGNAYNVRVKNAPLKGEREENAASLLYVYVDAELLMQGYE